MRYIFFMLIFFCATLMTTKSEAAQGVNEAKICLGLRSTFSGAILSTHLRYEFDCIGTEVTDVYQLERFALFPVHPKSGAEIVLFNRMLKAMAGHGLILDAASADTRDIVILTDRPGIHSDYCLRTVEPVSDFKTGNTFKVTLSCLNGGIRDFHGVKGEHEFESQFDEGSFDKLTFFGNDTFWWREKAKRPLRTVYAFRKRTDGSP
jgi:hypothetical protein